MQVKAADEKFCTECASAIKAKAVVCPQCGCPQQAIGMVSSSSQGKDKNTAGILSILLGGLGVHKFYLSRPLAGVLYMLFFWTFIPAILGLIDGVRLFGMSTQAFDREYNDAPR